MKQGKPLITFMMLALAAGLAVYFGVYALNTMEDPYSTTLVYPYTVRDSVAAEGLVVRDALVLPAEPHDAGRHGAPSSTPSPPSAPTAIVDRFIVTRPSPSMLRSPTPPP